MLFLRHELCSEADEPSDSSSADSSGLLPDNSQKSTFWVEMSIGEWGGVVSGRGGGTRSESSSLIEDLLEAWRVRTFCRSVLAAVLGACAFDDSFCAVERATDFAEVADLDEALVFVDASEADSDTSIVIFLSAIVSNYL